jgi:hypothetical protein
MRQITLRINAVATSGEAVGSNRHDDRRRRLRILTPAVTSIPPLISSGTFAGLMPFAAAKEFNADTSADDSAD